MFFTDTNKLESPPDFEARYVDRRVYIQRRQTRLITNILLCHINADSGDIVGVIFRTASVLVDNDEPDAMQQQ